MRYGRERCLSSLLFPSEYVPPDLIRPCPVPIANVNKQQRSICSYAQQFAGSEQHDSQEFLSWLLDALHEDLNRVISKSTYEVTPEREAELEKLPQQIASEQEWRIYRMRNDSIVVDFFQGQFRNRMECMTCHKVRCRSLSHPGIGCEIVDVS